MCSTFPRKQVCFCDLLQLLCSSCSQLKVNIVSQFSFSRPAIKTHNAKLTKGILLYWKIGTAKPKI